MIIDILGHHSFTIVHLLKVKVRLWDMVFISSEPLRDRVFLVQFNSEFFHTKIVQDYSPQAYRDKRKQKNATIKQMRIQYKVECWKTWHLCQEKYYTITKNRIIRNRIDFIFIQPYFTGWNQWKCTQKLIPP